MHPRRGWVHQGAEGEVNHGNSSVQLQNLFVVPGSNGAAKNGARKTKTACQQKCTYQVRVVF